MVIYDSKGVNDAALDHKPEGAYKGLFVIKSAELIQEEGLDMLTLSIAKDDRSRWGSFEITNPRGYDPFMREFGARTADDLIGKVVYGMLTLENRFIGVVPNPELNRRLQRIKRQ